MRYLSLLFVFGFLAANGQQPEKIYPYARAHNSITYYQEQSRLWKKETEKNPGNAAAWYNYYYANRNLGFGDTTRSRETKQAVITQLLDEMGRAIPESYEYNLCRWMNGNWDLSLIKYLEKAQSLGPDRPEHLDYSLVFAEMKGNEKDRDKWAIRKKEANQLSAGLIYYNYNVLAGLPPNAILITSGDNDTFPIWYLQALGIRRDVTVLHVMLVNLEQYRNSLYAKLGIPLEKSGTQNKTGGATQELVSIAASNTKGLPVYVGLTANSCARSAATENLYLAGLTYAYSTTPIDNIAVMKKNFELIYALDYIDKPFFDDISPDLVRKVNGNYIVPMLKLYSHYSAAGETRQAERMKKLLEAIVSGTAMEAEVKKAISQG